MEERLLPPRVGALQQGAKAVAGLSFGQVWKGQGGLALGICIGSLFIAAAIAGVLVHTLHLDNVWVDGLMARYLYLRASPLTGRHLDASGSALLRIPHLLQGWDRGRDAELGDVVRGDDVGTEGNPFEFVTFFSEHDVADFKAEFC